MSLAPEPNPELDVSTHLGTYRGWSGPKASHWSAIEYAEPPRTVKEKFSPTRPAEPFTGVRECLPHADIGRHTLSVTAPAGPVDPQAGLPVIVFVHGGRFQSGHANGPWYRGDAFAESGCIVISVNYRYRFEGFLPLEGEPLPFDFGADSSKANSELPYYRAVEDLITALRWIRDSISAFGGDPHNVTAMGQSAGGSLITYTLGSPRARDLVQRCVILSQGLPRVPWTARTRMARRALRGPLSFEHVSTLSDEQVAHGFSRYARRYFDDCAIGLFPHSPENMPPIPMLIGTLRDEFVRMGVAERLDTAYREGNPVTRALADRAIRLFSRSLGVPSAASKQEKKAWREYCDSIEPPRPLGRAIGDAAIRKFDVATMEAHAPQAPTWVYEFHGGAGDVRARGTDAQHCADIPLAFNCLDVAPVSIARFCGPNAQQRLQPLADRFHHLIVDFAHGSEPDWPTFHPDTGRLTKQFDMSTCAEDLVEDAHGPVRRFFLETYSRKHV